MALKQISDGVFVVDQKVKGFVPFSIRSTIFRFKDGTVLIHSPVRFSEDEVRTE